MATGHVIGATVGETLALMFGQSSNGSVPRHALAYVGLPDLLLSSLHLRPPCPLSGCDFPTTCCRHGALRFRCPFLSVRTPFRPSSFLREADLPSSSGR